jgi:hypothetical protein
LPIIHRQIRPDLALMTLYPISHNIATGPPSSSPAQKSNPQTPRRINRAAGLPSARASPYGSPSTVRLSDGSPMELKTPKKYMSDKAASRRHASSMTSPGMSPGTMGPPLLSPVSPTHTRPRGTNPTSPLFPPRLRFRRSSTLLAPAEIISHPNREKRVRDPTRPTVQLLRVLNKCWAEDTDTQLRWALKDGLLNGRGEERDRSSMWSSLNCAVGSMWPHLRSWIMRHIPSDDDTEWFTGADRIPDDDDEGCVNDPDIAAKHSSLGQVGFFSACPSFKL